MPSLVQQSTTQLSLKFLMVLTSDHVTGATGLAPTVTIRKEGGSFASPAGAVTEIANGWYQVAANSTDTNTLGQIALHATAATADPTDIIAVQVVAFNPNSANLGLATDTTNLNAIADTILDRDWSVGADTNTHTTRNALRFLRNVWNISAGVLTVFKENGATTAWQSNVSTDPAALPIVTSQPTT